MGWLWSRTSDCEIQINWILVPEMLLTLLLVLEMVIRSRSSKTTYKLGASIVGQILILILILLTMTTWELFFTSYELTQAFRVCLFGAQIVAWVVIYYSYTVSCVRESSFCTKFIILKLGHLWKLVQAIAIIFAGPLDTDAVGTMNLFYYLLVITLELSILQKFFTASTRLQEIPAVDECLYNAAGFFEFLFFTWVQPLIRLGTQRALEQEDAYIISPKEKAGYQSRILRAAFEAQEKPSIFWAIFRAYFSEIVVVWLQQFMYMMLNITPIFFIYELQNYIDNPDIPLWKGVAVLAYIVLVKFILLFNKNDQKFRVALLNSHIKACVCTEIFQKSMKISTATISGVDDKEKSSSANFTFAQTINLMQVDLERVSQGITWCLQVFTAPTRIIIYTVYLFMVFEWSWSLAAFAVIFASFIFNYIVARTLTKYNRISLEKKDHRIKQCNELLTNIKVFKLYNWEEKMTERVTASRNEELWYIRAILWLQIITRTIGWGTFELIMIGVMTAVIITGGVLNPGQLFTGIWAVIKLSESAQGVPNLINMLIQCSVSAKRMDAYLQCQEVEDYIERQGKENESISIVASSFSWEFKTPIDTMTLKEIDISIKQGEFIAVVGAVGSGKSSLLNALIGNMKMIRLEDDSRVTVCGSVAYANQVSWVLNRTIRDNILFGEEYDEKRYNQVISLWELERDFEILPGGDLTEIGEKGINLSGGQKARISMARVIYSNADILLLDDPLAAVDSHVGLNIFNNCFADYCKYKTRILVTHGQQYLSQVDRILYLDGGRIVDFGTFDELLNRCDKFADQFLIELSSQYSSTGQVEQSVEEIEEVDINKKDNTQVNIIADEEISRGRISQDVYQSYLHYFGGSKAIIIGFIAMLSWNIVKTMSQTSLADWSETDPAEQPDVRMSYYIQYIILCAACILAIFVRLALIWSHGLKAAKLIFEKAIESLANAPINNFYDITPSGRIINRLSKDLDKIDTAIYQTIGGLLAVAFIIIMCLSVLVIADPYILLIIPPVIYISVKIQQIYLDSGRDLTRLESVTRSPIVEHFSETITGTSTIRAFSHNKRFFSKMKKQLNLNMRQYITLESANCWLSVYLELVSNFILFTAISVIIFARGYISPAYAGLAITWGFWMPEMMYWLILMWAGFENQMVSVERMKSLITVPPEAPRTRHGDVNLAQWPYNGHVQFENLQMKYRDNTDIVLKGLSFEIFPKEKVGIVGRTGSGKSSIGVCLFRIVEAFGGRILIDGVNIADVGLDILRQKISLIPQDPALFQGTLRENVDPFSIYSTQELDEALKSIGFNQPLDKEIKENGDNLSAGERQQVCIARAILRKSKIMLLDEATASVDLKLDEQIQAVIRQMFVDCTVLTIAHRINTIMDYDRILVLDAGEKAEFDTPSNLMAKRGQFYKLVKKFSSTHN